MPSISTAWLLVEKATCISFLERMKGSDQQQEKSQTLQSKGIFSLTSVDSLLSLKPKHIQP